MDRERVEEAKEDERLAEQARRRRRTVADAVGEAMHAGDRLTVTCGARSWTGIATAASDDHVEIATGAGRVVANLGGPVVLRRTAATSGGTTGDRGHRSFRARLATIELAGEPVETCTPDGPVTGRLSVVGADHVVVDTADGEVWVPLRLLGVVVLD